uniref:Uncharacterized protein n=1 Tax=Anopheles funestus TaxID=62324 RepID=A0A182S029_ANOFN
MIEDVPVADRLHLLNLGNVRRLMMGWRDGTLGEPKSNERERHSFSLALQQTAQPCEVHRKIRHLKYLGYWKGSEFAFFFHYSSFVVLEGFENELQHLKRMMRSGWKSLEQAIGRISEVEQIGMQEAALRITYPSYSHCQNAISGDGHGCGCWPNHHHRSKVGTPNIRF